MRVISLYNIYNTKDVHREKPTNKMKICDAKNYKFIRTA